VLADDGYIYRIDTAAAFVMNDYDIRTAGALKSPGEYSSYINRILQRVDFSNKWNLMNIDMAMRILIEFHGKDKIDILLKPLYDIQKIRKSYINGFLETLCYFYPDCIGGYYDSFFTGLKKGVARYVSANNTYQSAANS
jgi:hypothetical protein